MVFKFGILVLLFALDGVLAKQELPPVPTADIVSALQQVPHFRRGLLGQKHSQIRSLVSNSVRRSLLSTERTCAWDVQTEECLLSLSRMKYLLEKSDTEFAEMLVEGLACVEKTNKKDCNNEKACLWDERTAECEYEDLRRGHEDSPCAKAAPRFFDSMEASARCEKIDSSEECANQRQCVWSSDDASCGSDHFLIFYGIENFQDQIAQITPVKSLVIGLEYAFLSFDENFTYQSYLDYKPNNTACLNDTDPIVCEYMDVLLSSVLGPQLYCSEKYESAASECNADDLCTWNRTSSECGRAESLLLAAAVSATRVLIDSMPDGIDKRVFDAMYDCDGPPEVGVCTGTCMWNVLSNECAANIRQFGTFFTEVANNSTDALCTYLIVDGQSDCYRQPFTTECQNTEFCRWNGRSRCEPTEEFHLSAAADRDRKLKKRYQRVKERCSSHTTEKACVE